MTQQRFGLKGIRLDTYGHTYQFVSYIQQINPRQRTHMTHRITYRVQGDHQ